MVGFQPFWTPQKGRKSRFLRSFLGCPFSRPFFLKKLAFLRNFLAFLHVAPKARLDVDSCFLLHFLRTPQAGDGDATCLEKVVQKWPQILENRRFLGYLSATPSWKGSQFIIFRLLAIEKRSWKFFFRLLVIFRQFLGSQHGLNFGLKMALKSIFC